MPRKPLSICSVCRKKIRKGSDHSHSHLRGVKNLVQKVMTDFFQVTSDRLCNLRLLDEFHSSHSSSKQKLISLYFDKSPHPSSPKPSSPVVLKPADPDFFSDIFFDQLGVDNQPSDSRSCSSDNHSSVSLKDVLNRYFERDFDTSFDVNRLQEIFSNFPLAEAENDMDGLEKIFKSSVIEEKTKDTATTKPSSLKKKKKRNSRKRKAKTIVHKSMNEILDD